MNKEMVLVQGTVKFEVDVAILVDVVTAENEYKLEDILLNKAIKNIDDSTEEVEIINDVNVTLSEETADKYIWQNISNDDWKEIIKESRELKS